MSALVLAVLLSAADAPSTEAPQLHVVAQLGLTGGARAVAPPQAPFFGSLEGLLGLRFDPVRFGVSVRGLFTNLPGVDLGGFFTVDLVRVKLDSKRALAFFTGVDVFGRLIPGHSPPWNAVVLGQTGVRLLGISIAVAGGAEVTSGAGDGEVRLGVDFVELFAH